MNSKLHYCFSSICLLLYELCYEYIMKFLFVAFPCRRSGCGRACMRGICLPVEFYARIRFVSVAWAVHHEPFARLLICWHFSLLHFPIRTETIFDDIQTYSVLDFLSLDGIPTYSVSQICNVSAILEVSGKLNFYWWTWIGLIDSSRNF